ncbi:hypothetical protein DN069_09985 [Streptacidiphilus pinicola]|uniref:Uncharacterized protein n=1 Tax=Streptacidiphilus pinicola TaxID=2219663 RepID=A0A2X0IL34_9ACTN|nr:hypothetical protein DN069_09985 [Streptacidiphilus pinicola]
MVAGLTAFLLVVGGVGWWVWPGGSDPRADGRAAAQTLAALPAVQLSTTFEGTDGAVTRSQLTVTAAGLATGTVHGPLDSTADLASTSSRTLLRGDDSYWGTHTPNDVGSAVGHWVTSTQPATDLGLDVSQLTPAALARLVTRVVNDPTATPQDAGTVHGQAATSFTAGGWTVLISTGSPHQVLGLGGSVGSGGSAGVPTSPGPSASDSTGTPGVSSAALLTAGSGPVAVPVDDSSYSPYVFIQPQPAAPAQAAAVPSAVATATSSPSGSPTGGGDGRVTQPPPAAFSAQLPPEPLCTSPTCSADIQVTNTGGRAAQATAFVSVSPGLAQTALTLGTVQPGATVTRQFSYPNQAQPGGPQVTVYVKAWLFSPSQDGPDPAAAERLQKRQLDPSKELQVTSLDPIYQPTAVRMLDLLTDQAGATNQQALEVLDMATTRGFLPELSVLSSSDGLQNPKDLYRLLSTDIGQETLPSGQTPAPTPGGVEQIGNRRVLEQVTQLFLTDPKAKIWYDGVYEQNGAKAKTDIIFEGTVGGRPVQRAYQIKTVTSDSMLGKRLGEAGKQLNGLGGVEVATGIPEQAPPGFQRIIQIYLEPTVDPRIYTADQAGLERQLSKRLQQAMRNLCGADGKPLADLLVVVNGTGVHEWTDLKAVGVPC